MGPREVFSDGATAPGRPRYISTSGLQILQNNHGDGFFKFRQAGEHVGEPPCTSCPFIETCATRLLACKDFLHYTEGWELEGDNLATVEIYQRIYKNSVAEKLACLVE